MILLHSDSPNLIILLFHSAFLSHKYFFVKNIFIKNIHTSVKYGNTPEVSAYSIFFPIAIKKNKIFLYYTTIYCIYSTI